MLVPRPVNQDGQNPPPATAASFESEIAQKLDNAGFSGFIYRGNSLVSFRESLDTYGTVPVSEIFSRFDELDPRVDNFMRKIGGYFDAGNGARLWSVFYLPAKKNPIITAAVLRKVLHNARFAAKGEKDAPDFIDFRLVEYRFAGKIPLLAAFFLFALLVVQYVRFKPLLLALGAIPFLFLLVNGNVYLLCASSILYFCWAKLPPLVLPMLKAYLYRGYKDRGDESPLTQLMVCVAALVLSALSVSVALKSALPGLLLLAVEVMDLLILGGAFLFYLVKKSRFEHRPFFYQSLRTKRRERRIFADGDPVLIGLLAFFLLLPLTSLLPAGRNLPLVPGPERVAGISGFSMDSIEKLRYYNTGDLPNLYDFFCHQAYQDSYYYGGSYAYPTTGAVVEMTGYSLVNGTVRQARNPVLNFDSEWFAGGLREIGAGQGMMRIVLEQKRPVVARMVRPKSPIPGILYIIIHCLSAAFLFSHLLQARTPLTAHGLYGMKVFIQRRKREAA